MYNITNIFKLFIICFIYNITRAFNFNNYNIFSNCVNPNLFGLKLIYLFIIFRFTSFEYIIQILMKA